MKTQEEIEVMLDEYKSKVKLLNEFTDKAKSLGCRTYANELNIVRLYYLSHVELIETILNKELPF